MKMLLFAIAIVVLSCICTGANAWLEFWTSESIDIAGNLKLGIGPIYSLAGLGFEYDPHTSRAAVAIIAGLGIQIDGDTRALRFDYVYTITDDDMESHSFRVLPVYKRYYFGPSVNFGDSTWLGFTYGYMIGG